MKKTFKIAVAGAGVGVISLAGAGLASAHGPGDSETRSEITDRVATILGVDSAELSDAFSTARDEVRTEQMDARLDQAVADGTITQEDADEIRAWQDSRPEVLDDLKGLATFSRCQQKPTRATRRHRRNGARPAAAGRSPGGCGRRSCVVRGPARSAGRDSTRSSRTPRLPEGTRAWLPDEGGSRRGWRDRPFRRLHVPPPAGRRSLTSGHPG